MLHKQSWEVKDITELPLGRLLSEWDSEKLRPTLSTFEMKSVGPQTEPNCGYFLTKQIETKLNIYKSNPNHFSL